MHGSRIKIRINSATTLAMVGIVHLKGHRVMKPLHAGALILSMKVADGVSQGASHHEVFLDETEFLACRRYIRRIQYLGNRLHIDLVFNRTKITHPR